MFELNGVTYYDIKEVCAMLKLHPATVRRYVKEKRLNANLVARSFLFSSTDLTAFIQAGAGKLGPSAGTKRKPPTTRRKVKSA